MRKVELREDIVELREHIVELRADIREIRQFLFKYPPDDKNSDE